MNQSWPTPAGGTTTFTVVIPAVLRHRFDQWLRRNHLRMTPIPGGDPQQYAVSPPGYATRQG